MYDKDSASNEFLWEKVPHATELYFHDKKFSKLLLKFSRKFESFKNLVGSKASEDGTNQFFWKNVDDRLYEVVYK